VELERRRVVPRPGISDSGIGLWDRWLGMTGTVRPATHPGPVGAPEPWGSFLAFSLFSVPCLGCPAPAGRCSARTRSRSSWGPSPGRSLAREYYPRIFDPAEGIPQGGPTPSLELNPNSTRS
jgi:hypothetical protein